MEGWYKWVFEFNLHEWKQNDITLGYLIENIWRKYIQLFPADWHQYILNINVVVDLNNNFTAIFVWRHHDMTAVLSP